MHAAAQVGDVRIAIVHGDCEGLAGWGLSREALAHDGRRARVTRWFTQANARIIASSHSCLPVLAEFSLPDGTATVINNGAAGMPNFAGARYGVITRIGLQRSPHQALYGTRIRDVHVEALPVRYDHQRWLDDFLANWPPGSAGHASYHRRIVNGPVYDFAEAMRMSAGNAMRQSAPQPA